MRSGVAGIGMSVTPRGARASDAAYLVKVFGLERVHEPYSSTSRARSGRCDCAEETGLRAPSM